MNWNNIYLTLLKVTNDEDQAREALAYLIEIEDMISDTKHTDR